MAEGAAGLPGANALVRVPHMGDRRISARARKLSPPMTTKATRKDHIKALARCVVWTRANAGDAANRGDAREAEAWLDVAAALADLARYAHIAGLPRQESLFSARTLRERSEPAELPRHP